MRRYRYDLRGGRTAIVSSERYTNDFIDALKKGTVDEFRRKYRECSAFIVDYPEVVEPLRDGRLCFTSVGRAAELRERVDGSLHP